MGTEAKPGPWELPGGLGPVGEPLEGPWCSEQHRLESRSPRGRAAPLGPCDVHLRTSWGQQGGGGCAQDLSFSNSVTFSNRYSKGGSWKGKPKG